MKKYLKLSLLLIPTTTIIMVSFNNCARFEADQIASGTIDSSSTGVGSLSTSDLPENPYALLSAEQTLASMLKVTNVETASNTIKAEYNLRYGGLAGGNSMDLANAPLLLGSTSLAGEVCNAMIVKEAALPETDRAFLGSINFAKGVTSISDAAFSASIRGMSRSFMGRNETSGEMILLNQFKSEFIEALDAGGRSSSASTSNLLIGVCAALLSSVDALSY